MTNPLPFLDLAGTFKDLHVTAENVLYVYRTLLNEYENVQDALSQYEFGLITVDQCANDPVSKDAAISFPERMRALEMQCADYNERLAQLAINVRSAARQYGYTEDQIASQVPIGGTPIQASFNSAGSSTIAGGTRTFDPS